MTPAPVMNQHVLAVMVRWIALVLLVGVATHDFWTMWVVGAAGSVFVRRAEVRHNSRRVKL